MGRNARIIRERQQKSLPPQQSPILNSNKSFQHDLERWRQDRSQILADVLTVATADPQLMLVYGREWTPEEIRAAVASIEHSLDTGQAPETNNSPIFTNINQKEKAS